MNAKKVFMFFLAALFLVTFVSAGMAQEKKKKKKTSQPTEAAQPAADAKTVDADVGWVTLDQKTLVLVKDGKHVMDLEISPEIPVGTVKVTHEIGKGSITDVLSGRKAQVVFVQQGDKMVAQKITVTMPTEVIDPSKKKKKKK